MEPWQYSFMQRALLEVVLIALAASTIGVLLTLRRLAYAGESLGHALVPGAAVFVAIGLPGDVGATIGAITAAIAVAWLVRREEAREDVAVALVFAVALAVGVAILSITAPAQRVLAILLGDVLAVDRADLIAAAAVGAIIIAAVVGGQRVAVTAAFDPAWSRVAGIRPGVADVALLIGTALALGASLRGLGALLSVALLLGPAAIARPWVTRTPPLLIAAPLIGSVLSIAGLLLSYHAGLAAGPAIATLIAGCFLLSRAASIVVAQRPSMTAASRR